MAAVVFLVIAVASIVIGRGGISMPSFGTSGDVQHITGAISPEQEIFFQDPDTIKALKKHDIELELDVYPAQEMMGLIDGSGKQYDFYMPELDGAARTLEVWDVNSANTKPDGPSKEVFSTPLIALVHSDLVEDMKAHDLVKDTGGQKSLNLYTLVEMSQNGTRWRDISPSFGSPRVVDVAVPRITESNAALRYASVVRLAGMAVAAQEHGKGDTAQLDELAQESMHRLIADQGYGETTSQGMLDAFLRVDKGEMPMVLTTEEQYLRQVSGGKDMSQYTPLLLSPPASLISTVVPRTEKGAVLADALGDDKAQEAAAQLGLRTKTARFFAQFAEKQDYGIPVIVNEDSPKMWDYYEGFLQEFG
ncbi:putative secreted protein [Corynebacterium minutissimum]|uniref:Putative secreted protein n=1 Tax=Corynebacterium minutissimum TaxID=38301 RepID=A0A376D032_9CORY|nr:putative secreted protein [Corynebacterium minutissimum]